jgi:hypothetical protein
MTRCELHLLACRIDAHGCALAIGALSRALPGPGPANGRWPGLTRPGAGQFGKPLQHLDVSVWCQNGRSRASLSGARRAPAVWLGPQLGHGGGRLWRAGRVSGRGVWRARRPRVSRQPPGAGVVMQRRAGLVGSAKQISITLLLRTTHPRSRRSKDPRTRPRWLAETLPPRTTIFYYLPQE